MEEGSGVRTNQGSAAVTRGPAVKGGCCPLDPNITYLCIYILVMRGYMVVYTCLIQLSSYVLNKA